MYRLLLDDSYHVTELAQGSSQDQMVGRAVRILMENGLPVSDLHIWPESAGKTVIDYGSWTHYFYVERI